jgi:gliding motility-associated-like protein
MSFIIMKERMNHILSLPLRISIFSVLLFFTPDVSSAQCAVTISNFPYNENFETSNGNWVGEGTFSDWTWGTPSKPVINAAGSGSKCWITGGLKNPGYNDGENSWLRSPCFNFTNLKDPYLKFKVFWETEGKYDGANLQYSTDNGANWQLLGNINENNNCLTENWFNAISVLSLGNQDAWSGNIQSSTRGCFISGGSAGWVTAKHDIPNLAGNPNVMFRFVFASSASCNDFDGFAVDDFTIEEAPASKASFTYSCSSNLRVNFKNTSTLCPTSFLWNFGDPSSGENTSTLPNPTHAYTLGGNYSISLTVSGPGNTSSTFTLTKLEIIENIVASIVTPIRCHDDTTGSLTVNFTGDSSAVSYKWDTNPVQTTRTAIRVGAGFYNITILNAEGCPASANISMGEPPPLLYTLTTVKPGCTASNGSIDITMSGGSPPYSYSWLPGVSNTSSAKNLPSGAYRVAVTDNNLCYKIINIDLPDAGDLSASISSTKDVRCFGGNNGMAIADASRGSKHYVYSWSSPGGNTAVINNLSAGSYTTTVTDANGCKAFATAIIKQPPALTSVMKLKNTFCGYDNGNAVIEAYGGIGPYQYSWSPGNYTNSSVSNLAPGQYTVVIKDNNGCTKNDTALIASSSAVNLELSHTDVLCAGDLTGAAKAIATGGTTPYNFQWANDTQIFNSNAINSVTAGVYNLKVQDAAGCSVTASVNITQPDALKVEIATKPSYCDLSNGSASAAVSGGTLPYTFLWTPRDNTTSSLTNAFAGNYQLTVTDKNNCSVSLLTTIFNDKPRPVFIGNDTTLCPGSTIILSPGIYKRYKWQDNSGSANYSVINEGTYSVEVTDDLGCILKDTIKIIGDCGFIFFPNAFTPNDDLQNDFFGPHGILSTLKDYTLIVYNRLGQLVFKSTDPFRKWDGKMQKQKVPPGTYVWIARYSHKEVRNIEQKGTVTVLY